MYLLVADDLTGGNDSGIQFAKRGLPARLLLSADRAPANGAAGEDGSVLIVNSNTRNLPALEAANCVAAIAAALQRDMPGRPAMVFKKIDSTLRGNLGAEMDALMDGFSFRTAFLAPSYPQQGRTVTGGMLLVHGIPVHQTGFADDPLTPIRESSVAAILGGQTRRATGTVPLAVLESGPEPLGRHIAALRKNGAGCIIFDAETPEHLAAIAATGLSMPESPLFLGSAGLAEALAGELSHGQQTAAVKQGPPVDRILFVCGSANQATHAQTAALSAAGVPVIHMPEACLNSPAEAAKTAQALLRALDGGAACLAAPVDRIGAPGSMVEGMALSAAIAGVTLSVLRGIADAPDTTALVMTGGETAYAVLREIATILTLREELLPGIALCAVDGGPWNGLRAVTKAGGFGTPRTFVELLHMLRQKQAA